MEIHNLNDPAHCEAIGLSKVFKAYAEQCPGELIFMCGFNDKSRYVYICLENGVSICSKDGKAIEYHVQSVYDGSETFVRTYKKAIKLNDKINGYENQ
jgi:hypothetical protein